MVAGKGVAVVEVVNAVCSVLMAIGRVVDGARRSMDGARRSLGDGVTGARRSGEAAGRRMVGAGNAIQCHHGMMPEAALHASTPSGRRLSLH